LDILFHRNDPKEIYGYGNNGPIRERTPDVIVASVHSASRAAGLPTDAWLEIASKGALEQPHSRFQWYDVLSAVELQHTAKINEEDVDAYRDNQRAMIPIDPHTVNTGPKSKKRNMHSESMPSAAEHPVKRVKSETSSIAPSTMHLRPTPARTIHESTTLVAVPERQPTRRSTLSSAPADVAYSPPKIVQCGLYAMEMLCGSYGVSHSINLFIIDANLWILYADRQGL